MSQTHGSWGERLCTFRTTDALVTLLFLKPHQRCSWHKHKRSYNKFTCVSGKVGIKTDKGYTTVLLPKQEFTVEPGVMHEFQTYELTTVVEEIAFVRYDESDIEREQLGGELLELFPKKSAFNNVVCNVCGRGIDKASEMISVKEDEIICKDCFKINYPNIKIGEQTWLK